ncbi:TRAP transporter small permease [Actibacterium sp. D379-3]
MALAQTAEQVTGRALARLARGLALCGGLVLIAVALVTAASITGRALTGIGLGPVTGDYELVEAGCAIAVFAFLPWCQLQRGHVAVDIVIRTLPARAQALFALLGDTAITLASVVILWRLWLGFGEKFPYGADRLRAALSMGGRPYFPETTYELGLPVWIPFALALIGAALFFLVSLYTMWRSLNLALGDGEAAP